MGNNPVSFIDPDGQFAFIPIAIALGKAIAVGAAIGGVSYTAGVGFSKGGFQNWNWGQFGKSVGIGAVGGAVTFGIGSAAGAIGGMGGFAVQTAGHATWGGISSMWNGGDFWSGALSGGVGNIVGSATAGMGAGIQMGASGLMGGISADLAGGDFWRGFATGATVAGANHLMHDPPGSMKKRLEAYKKELLANAPKLDPITDALGIADYYMSGRRVGNIVYDINGNPVRTDFSYYGEPYSVGSTKGAYTLVKELGKFQYWQRVRESSTLSGQARAVFTQIKNSFGKTVRFYKDSYKIDGRLYERAHKLPNYGRTRKLN